jgi:hypothetical protein
MCSTLPAPMLSNVTLALVDGFVVATAGDEVTEVPISQVVQLRRA